MFFRLNTLILIQVLTPESSQIKNRVEFKLKFSFLKIKLPFEIKNFNGLKNSKKKSFEKFLRKTKQSITPKKSHVSLA